ncbi:GspH/FimT family pseudopilin [Polaromonas sp. YR568]|uniref:GspH/FimT family pseudopilin n=1 Tax=Polaromonas sp. YR568 TaxID=1855301 RepID=UPI00398BF7CD
MRGPRHRQTTPAATGTHSTRPRGFTLTELLVIMAIIAIFASFAIPSFRGLTASTSVSSAVNAFVSDTRYARGEAMRRGKSVTICRSANAAAIPPRCSGASEPTVGSWMEGWVVFVDENGNGAFNATSDTVLRVQQALPGIGGFLAVNTGGTAANDRNYIVYQATGRAVGLLSRWLVRPPGAASAANTRYTRTLCMNFVGRVRTLSGEVPCPA